MREHPARRQVVGEMHLRRWPGLSAPCLVIQWLRLATAQDKEVQREQLRCEACDGWWRPDIVWFEDYLDDAVVKAATEAIAGCDLLVSVGTSAVVYPAAALPRKASTAACSAGLETRPSGLGMVSRKSWP